MTIDYYYQVLVFIITYWYLVYCVPGNTYSRHNSRWLTRSCPWLHQGGRSRKHSCVLSPRTPPSPLSPPSITLLIQQANINILLNMNKTKQKRTITERVRAEGREFTSYTYLYWLVGVIVGNTCRQDHRFDFGLVKRHQSSTLNE